MRCRLITILLCFILVGDLPRAHPLTRSKFNAETWVRAKIDELVKAAGAAYESDDALPAYETLLRSIARTIRKRNLSTDEGFAIRYRKFLDYIQAISLDQLPGHELGFNVPDKQYFEETRALVGIPEFLTGQSFLRSVSRYETIDRAKSFLRRVNSTRQPGDQLLFFSYTSQHLGTPDNDDSHVRLLIVVPGNAALGVPEKWVQFGVTDPRARPRIRNISVVSAIAASDGTYNAYFKDYFRTYRRDGSISIKGRWELGQGDDNCVRCHKSGVIPIFPEKGSVSPSEEQVVTAVNERYRSYGSPRFDKYLDASKFGPGLGAADRADREHRFGTEFTGTAVASAMKCGICHQRERLGALNWPMDSVIVNSFIKGGKMPLGYKLDESERQQLYQKVIREYFDTDDVNPGILKSWLLGRHRQS